MSRLQRERERLYGADTPGGASRALVLELAGPAPWATLAAAWRGVQVELDLSPPAIAVNGADGLQLWFALPGEVTASQAQAFLGGLRLRYLGDVPAVRVRLRGASGAPLHRPPRDVAAGQWSAFIAPDLAPIFEDTPWLDLPPGDEGQADLLARLQPITPAAFAQALARLQPVALAAPDMAEVAPVTVVPPPGNGTTEAPAHAQARAFLLSVMNDATAPLALRVEAARALLPYA